MIKKDNYITGMLTGIVTPVIFYIILYGIDLLVIKALGRSFVKFPHYLILLAVTPNLFWMRYYLGKLKYTKSGFSVLVITTVYILLYFFKYFQTS
jgi:hypothetical protein